MNNLKNFAKLTIVNGGASYNLSTGELNPETGYMVALFGHEQIVDLTPLHLGLTIFISLFRVEEAIKDYTLTHAEILTQSDHFIGAWINENKLYLDISVKVENLTSAMIFGYDNKQIAIFDNNTKKEVFINYRKASNLLDIENFILQSDGEVVEYKGKLITLPTPQKTGTLTQRRAYAYTSAKQFANL